MKLKEFKKTFLPKIDELFKLNPNIQKLLRKANTFTPKTINLLVILTEKVFDKKKNQIELFLFKKIIEAIILESYYSEHMQEKNINVMDYIEKDINEIIQGKDFKNLDNKTKEKVFIEFYNKWTHPDNEVRNRMKLFSVRSPIIKSILD